LMWPELEISPKREPDRKHWSCTKVILVPLLCGCLLTGS